MIDNLLNELKFNHLGLAVKNDKQTLIMLTAMGYKIGERIFDSIQNVYVRLCTSENKPNIEIVQQGDSDKSPIDNILSKYDELIYHTCYEVDDLSNVLSKISEYGLKCITLSDRKPAKLFNGRHVSFYKIFGFGIIELLEKI
jgi:hypothetical protein